MVLLQKKISKKDVNKPIMDELMKIYPQLKYTKKFKVSKKGIIMYKVIDKVN